LVKPKAYFGVEGLDVIAAQGLSYGSQIMVQGETGIGKTVLAGQFIKEGLLCGDTCVYVACDEAPGVMRNHLIGFNLCPQAYEQANRLVFVDAYEQEESAEAFYVNGHGGLDKYFCLEREILKAYQGRCVRLVVDSFSTLAADVEPVELINFHQHRLKYLRKNGILAMDVFVNDVLDPRAMTSLAHMYYVIVKMNFGGGGTSPTRMIQLGKLKSGKFSASRYMFTIHQVFGIIMALDLEVLE